jgi:hypothetical protein
MAVSRPSNLNLTGNDKLRSLTEPEVGGAPALPTGGVVVYQGGYRYHAFTTSGDFVVAGALTVEYLVVGGGGSGANGGGQIGQGGGGAGGLLSATGVSITAGTHTVVVGAGGLVAGPTNGGNSSLGSVATAVGGGSANSNAGGNSGGSGAGAVGGAAAGSGTGGQGYAGGVGYGSGNPSSGGGGGGAGGLGGNSPFTNQIGQAGLGSVWTANGVTYAAGGRGNTTEQNGFTALAGAANTGNGGDGGCGYGPTSGAAGGSGVVIIRYPYDPPREYIEPLMLIGID